MTTTTRQDCRRSRASQHGLTLVELLVAMTIGLFLIAGIVSLFAANKQSFRASEALSRLQESGRFATEFLSRDLRLAGYREVTAANMTALPNAVLGWNGATADPSGLSPSLSGYVSGTDVLQVRYIQPTSSPAVDRTVTYYIGTGTTTEPGLRQRTVDTVAGTTTSTTEELIPGVVDMQVLYGLDTSSPRDGRLDSYADTPADWNQVIAARINLLLRSEDRAAEAPMSLPFLQNNGAFFSAASNDRRIYQMFSATVGLRNRLL